jgi:hypothetical protein
LRTLLAASHLMGDIGDALLMDTQAFWHFHCPECGFGDAEHGHLLTAHEIYCLICQEEHRRQVRLHRWEAVEVKEPTD